MDKKIAPDDVKFIINILRQGSVKWSGRKIALDRARRKVCEGRLKNGQKKWKYYWNCAKCNDWFRDQNAMEVDHVIEIGPFCGDWNRYLPRMFPNDPDALQVLCTACHLKKTLAYNSARSKWKRKKAG